MFKMLVILGLVFTSVTVSATVTTTSWKLSEGGAGKMYGADWNTTDYNYGTGYNEISFSSGSQTVDITGWADSGPGWAVGDDAKVYQGDMYYWGDSYGWGIVNLDEDKGSPEHSIDNQCDYDMVLLSFNHAVSLDKVKVGWTDDGFSDTSLAVQSISRKTKKSLESQNSTWDDILGASKSDLSEYTMAKEKNGDAYYTLGSGEDSQSASKYWLVGLYDGLFNHDVNGFKLLGFKTSKGTTPPPTEVPEPSSVILFLLACAFVYRKSQTTANSEQSVFKLAC